MKLYEARPRSFKINEVECVKETSSQYVIISGDGKKERVAKTSHFSAYLKSFDEAKNYIIKYYQNAVDTLESRLEYEKDNLLKAKNINP